MTPPPRSLRFAVGTSLLSASLSLASCTEKSTKQPADAPDKQPPVEEEDHINVGPEDPPPEPKPEPQPEPIHVNEGPQPEPQPNPEPQPEPDSPKRVNVRPTPE